MISSYEKFSAWKQVKHFFVEIILILLHVLFWRHRKITDKVYDVTCTNHFSVSADYRAIHLVFVCKGSMTIFYYVSMVKISQCWSEVNQTFRPAPFPNLSFCLLFCIFLALFDFNDFINQFSSNSSLLEKYIYVISFFHCNMFGEKVNFLFGGMIGIRSEKEHKNRALLKMISGILCRNHLTCL